MSPLSHLEAIVLVAAAALAGLLLATLSFPVPWLIGPMVVGISAAIRNRKPLAVPTSFFLIGHVILGVASGIGFPPSTLLLLGEHALPLVGLVLVMIGLSLVNSFLLTRWTGLDPATALMGSLPGASNSMVIMAEAVGANTLMVAVLQYVRQLIVVLIVPPSTTTLFPAEATSAIAPSLAGIPLASPWLNVALLCLVGAAGVVFGKLVRLPAPTFLGPLLATLALTWSLPFRLEMPPPVFAGAMVLLGLVIAGRFDISQASLMRKVALVKAGLVLGMIVISLAFGYLFAIMTGVEAVTAVLGSTPGGMEVMVATAADLGADPGLVLAMQLIRWFAIILAGPWITTRLMIRYRHKQSLV